jgi:hypothetical protein
MSGRVIGTYRLGFFAAAITIIQTFQRTAKHRRLVLFNVGAHGIRILQATIKSCGIQGLDMR